MSCSLANAGLILTGIIVSLVESGSASCKNCSRALKKNPTLPLDTSEPQTEMLKIFDFIFSTVVSVIVKEHKCMCVFQRGEECQCDTAVVEVR